MIYYIVEHHMAHGVLIVQNTLTLHMSFLTLGPVDDAQSQVSGSCLVTVRGVITPHFLSDDHSSTCQGI